MRARDRATYGAATGEAPEADAAAMPKEELRCSSIGEQAEA
jgi:hypothetical protein